MSQCENQAIGINSVSALGLCTFKIMTWAQKQQWLSQRKDDKRRILRLAESSAKLFSKDLAQLHQNIRALRNTINSVYVYVNIYDIFILKPGVKAGRHDWSQVPEILDLCWVTQHIPSRTFHELSKVIFPESTGNVLQPQIASCHLTINS